MEDPAQNVQAPASATEEASASSIQDAPAPDSANAPDPVLPPDPADATVVENPDPSPCPEAEVQSAPPLPTAAAGEVASDSIDKTYTTRLPNIALPGPADGVSFALSIPGVPVEEIIPEEKDFDAARVCVAGGKITVFPKKDGDHVLVVPLSSRGGKVFVCKFMLTVTPDPKTLWKDVPVPEGTPFAKPDRDSVFSDDGAVRVVAASRRGRSHAQQGTCRDDDMAFWSDPDTGRYVLVVADGAGSAKFSRQGSKIAVETAVRELSEKLTDAVWTSEGTDFSAEGNVGKVLVGAARAAVGAIDAFVKTTKADPASGLPDLSLKDFNTTLLMAVVKRFADGSLRGATFSIGDGAIAWWQPGTARLLCAPDGGEFSGQTKFLTTMSVWKEAGADYAAFQKARCFTFQKAPNEAAEGRLFLMTDGVSDPFFETDNLMRDPAEWEKFQKGQIEGLALFAESRADAADAASKRLLDWLSFWSVGNHDDRTIAVFGAAPLPPPTQAPEPSEQETAPEESSTPPKPSLLKRLLGGKE